MDIITYNGMRLLFGISFFVSLAIRAVAQQPGDVLPAWKTGNMDIHHINTGLGNATFFILPDGTTLLIDAGAMDPTKPRTLSKRNTAMAPGRERQPGEWIARHISKVMTMSQLSPKLDYAQITHFHDDHMGAPSSLSRQSPAGNFVLTGITEVAAHLPVDKVIDRGFPDYDYPRAQQDGMMKNYKTFVDWQRKNKGTVFERSRPGRKDQIVLRNNPAPYAHVFEVRNIVANGELWTGLGENTRQLFPELKGLAPSALPSENMCSIGIRLSYGKFDYFSGGDMPGVLRFGAPLWNDVETPVSLVVGPVDAHILNHHGNRDSQNDALLASLRPRILIIPVWSSDHPGHDVLDRIYSESIYPGERDVFATDMLEANKLVIGDLLSRLKSDDGHIVIRVAPGGDTYQVLILDDCDEKLTVKSIHGPYQAR
jgi:beta-lactamase superfamily II metal-dependent hydrolase